MTDWDALVVGAGPAGSLLARGLAADGLRVLLVERERWPRWKVCGACLGPDAHAALEAEGLGAVPERGGAVPLRRTTLHAHGRRAELRTDGWRVWSRARLDAALVGEAVRAGAVFRPGTRARIAPVRGEARVVTLRSGAREETTTASVVVDASGLGGGAEMSRPPARPRREPGPRVGLGALFPAGAADLPAGRLHMVVGRGGYVGLTRLEDETIDVAAAVDPGLLRGRTPAGAVAHLLATAGLDLEGPPPLVGWKGTPPLGRVHADAAARRLFRLGDALAFVEPFTGEGIGWALQAARALRPIAARAAERWDDALAAAWDADHRGRAARGRLRCALLARGLRSEALVSLGVRVLAAAPWLARPWVRGMAAA